MAFGVVGGCYALQEETVRPLDPATVSVREALRETDVEAVRPST